MEEDKGSIGWGILGFFEPIVGLVLFIIWKESRPKSAKKAGIGALLGVILTIALIGFFLHLIFKYENKTTCRYYNDMKVCCDSDMNCKIIKEKNELEDEIIVEVNETKLIAKLENNVSSRALVNKLKEHEIIITARDYGNFEKVGYIDFTLPTSDEMISTEPGDLILYNGNQITLYYDTNRWMLTKLGHIDIEKEELKSLLGEEDTTFILKLKEEIDYE